MAVYSCVSVQVPVVEELVQRLFTFSTWKNRLKSAGMYGYGWLADRDGSIENNNEKERTLPGFQVVCLHPRTIFAAVAHRGIQFFLIWSRETPTPLTMMHLQWQFTRHMWMVHVGILLQGHMPSVASLWKMPY